MFLEVSQNSQENTCARVSFLTEHLRWLFLITRAYVGLQWYVNLLVRMLTRKCKSFRQSGIYMTRNTYPGLSLITISSVTNSNLSPNILSSVGLTCLTVVVSRGDSILLGRNDNFLKIVEQKKSQGHFISTYFRFP